MQLLFFFPGEVLSGDDGVPRERVLQQNVEFERIEEVTRFLAASSVRNLRA